MALAGGAPTGRQARVCCLLQNIRIKNLHWEGYITSEGEEQNFWIHKEYKILKYKKGL